eukprot:scaffold1466_cov159-Amphora_coffeaeformis.AAC.8
MVRAPEKQMRVSTVASSRTIGLGPAEKRLGPGDDRTVDADKDKARRNRHKGVRTKSSKRQPLLPKPVLVTMFNDIPGCRND